MLNYRAEDERVPNSFATAWSYARGTISDRVTYLH